MHNTLISVIGPTAVGKTRLAIDLAQYYQTQIVSADSRQCYHEMNIGTAKPSVQELSLVKHHFINSHSIQDYFSAGEFEKMTLEKLESLFLEFNPIIMAGGSGLYVNAVIKGFAEIPKVAKRIRDELIQRLNTSGLEGLYARLLEVDPEYAGLVDKHNPQRVLRALEVFEGTGKPYSFWRNLESKKRNFDVISIGLELDREELYDRIDSRMDRMIKDGLFEEAENLLEHRNLNPLQTVGYKEIFDYKLGKYDRDECVRLLKRNSRRYAKRQLTWFKKDKKTCWFHPNDFPAIIDFAEKKLKS